MVCKLQPNEFEADHLASSTYLDFRSNLVPLDFTCRSDSLRVDLIMICNCHAMRFNVPTEVVALVNLSSC